MKQCAFPSCFCHLVENRGHLFASCFASVLCASVNCWVTAERLQQCRFPSGRFAHAHVWCLCLRSSCACAKCVHTFCLALYKCQKVAYVHSFLIQAEYVQKFCLALYMCEHHAYQFCIWVHIGVGHSAQ